MRDARECALTAANCANCGSPLVGPYCAQCGQHAHGSARALGVLFHDAWHVLTHVDGRFWQTLKTLLLRPGRLTREYFAERRASYIPPARLYLVLSVLFFALGALGPQRTLSFDSSAEDLLSIGERDELRAEVQEAASASRAAGLPVKPLPQGKGAALDPKRCESLQADPPWLEATARRVCASFVADGGRALIHDFVAALPKMMFVFLPLMALVMLLIYWFPRRYYVEHLVFFLHTHAALFLILIIEMLLSPLAHALPWLATPLRLLRWVGVLYAAWYIYKAMRVYYGQGRWLTLTKLAVVSFAYVVFGSVTLVLTGVTVVLLS